MKPRIILYGHFGSGNIGNDTSLEAALFHIKKYQPNADILCVCSGPQVVAERFGIQTLPISGRANQQSASRITRVLLHITAEVQFWLRRPFWLHAGDRFIVVGTGAVDDLGVRHPLGAPYQLYKWCKIAKMGGAQILFLSVGVGPIMNRISRFLMLRALKMADYRSYRETAAFNYLKEIGVDTSRDFLYPDLVFSLPKESLPGPKGTSSNPIIVGLGLISYHGWRYDPGLGEDIYQAYFSKIKSFASWLFSKGFIVCLIFGDKDDRRPVNEFIAFVNKQGQTAWRERLIAEEIANVNQLFDRLAQTDLVVASRFHNVLCSLMLEKPVISLGYHEKNVNLMTEMGLEKFCQNIEQFTLEKLVEQFECHESDMKQAVQQIHDKNEQYRQLLDEQYRNIFSN